MRPLIFVSLCFALLGCPTPPEGGTVGANNNNQPAGGGPPPPPMAAGGSNDVQPVQEPGDVALEDPNLIVPEGSVGNFGTIMPGERVVFQLEDVFDASPGDILRVYGNYWSANNGEFLIERITIFHAKFIFY